MIEKFLDPYEIKARIAPGLILSIAVLVDVVYTAPLLSNLPLFAASGICSLALIYGLGNFARARGEAIEPRLWSSWAGPPSTRFLRHRDHRFGDGLKASIREELSRRFGLKLPSSDDEAKNSDLADKEIVDSFRQVRSYLRKNDPDGLWQKHNIEYGFCRNLLGCRVGWAVLSIAALAFAVVNAIRTGQSLVNPASIVALLSFACALYVGWFLLPKGTKSVADEYAESAWMAFLHTSQAQPAKTEPVRAGMDYIKIDPASR
ncbi:MAG: hypothetical protein WA182_00095 [Candidatus Sulfotelmatobacter sp.]